MDDVTVVRSVNASMYDYELYEYAVTFVGEAVAGDVPQLQVADVASNGCGEMANATTGHVVETTVQESFVPLYRVQNTEDISYNAESADVKAAIESLSGVCNVDVSRSIRGNGYQWFVTFSDRTHDRLLRAMRPNALLLNSIASYVTPQASVVPILQAGLSTSKSGVPHYVRACAINAVGPGEFRISSPSSLQPAPQAPGAPRFAKMVAVSDTELSVQWESPLSYGGESITEYIVEWDTVETFDSGADGGAKGSTLVDATARFSIADVQAIRLSVDDALYLSGSFALEYDGQRTSAIPFDASSTVIETVLENVCTIGDVSVSRTLGPANGGYTWLVTLVSAAPGEEAGDGGVSTTSSLQTVKSHKLKVDGENLLACTDETREVCWSDPDRTSVGVETRREIQRLLCEPTTDFMLSYMGESTGSLPSTANATDIEKALEALYTIGDVVVTGNCDRSGAYVYVTFENALGDLPALSSSEEGEFEEVVKGSTQVVVGRKPFSYSISGISGEIPWHVRIAAYNRIGYGEFIVATHDSSNKVWAGVGAPTLPLDVSMKVESAHSVWMYWDAPASDGGDTITEYVVQWDVSDGFDSSCGDGPEVQTISVSSENASHAGETFNLTIDGTQYLTCLEWNTGVFEIQDGLRSAGGELSEVVVTRGGDGSLAWNYGYTYSVTFVHNASDDGLANFPELQVTSCASGRDDVTFDVETLKDGTEFEDSACQVNNLLPTGSATITAEQAEGAGDSSIGAFGYLIMNLASGVSYRVRVSAANSVGRSPWAFMGYPRHAKSFVPTAVPKLACNVTVVAGAQAGMLRVSFGLPFGTNVDGVEGLPLQGFRVEMARRVYEKQVVSVVFSPDSGGLDPGYPNQGSFTLSVGNASTWCLDWNSSVEDIELALDSLPTVDGISVEALGPEVNSTGNGTTSEFSSRPLLVSFTGPVLSNGDQDVMGVSLCESLDAGAYLDIYTVTDGEAGVVNPIITVSTSGDNETHVSGSYIVSFGYRADLDLRLGEGNNTSVYVMVEAGSTTLYSSADLAHYITAGEIISVGGVELVVYGKFSCQDTVAWDNELDEYPCTLEVETPHPHGATNVAVYGASNSLGSVHVTSGSSYVLTDWDLTSFLIPGDSIVIRDPESGEYLQSITTSVSNISLQLEDGYKGSSTVCAAAFFRPYAVVPSDASAEELRDAIESLPSIGSAEVTRQGPDDLSGFTWSVTLTSFYGPLTGGHTLQVTSETARAFEISECGHAGNGTFVATGKMMNGRMQYKLLDRPSYIEYASSADDGLGLWVISSEGIEEPYASAVLGADSPSRDSLVPPSGGASYWSTGCLVAVPSSSVTLLTGIVTSSVAEVGAGGSFSTLVKDIVTAKGLPEVQAIQLGASSDALDGTFQVDFGDSGGFTAAWDISDWDMEVREGCIQHPHHVQTEQGTVAAEEPVYYLLVGGHNFVGFEVLNALLAQVPTT